MPKATLSILGLYNYDNTIFDHFNLPDDLQTEKDTIVDNILIECAEFEVLYADSDFMKFAIDKWSKKSVPIWEHLYNTTQYEYDPIYNYDRTEKWTEEDNRKIQNDRTPNLSEATTYGKKDTVGYGKTDTTTYGKTDTLTHNTTDTLTHNTTVTLTNGHVVTDAQNSYENAGFIDAVKQTNSGNDVTATTGTETTGKTGTDTNVGSGTDTLASSGTDTSTLSGTDTVKTTGSDKNIEQHSGKYTRDGHLYGNIGVTSSQDLINQEREIALFNIIDKIIDDFKLRFCLLVY